MKWLLENLGLVVVVLVATVSFLRGVFRTLKGDADAPPRRIPPKFEDPEAAERTRRVQEEIRRKIAERRAAAEAAERGSYEQPGPAREVFEAPRERIPPLVRPTQTSPLDPFGGPMRKIVRKLEEAAEAAERKFEMSDDGAAQAALERQRRLEEQMRALEAARAAEERRAAEIAAAHKEERSTVRVLREMRVPSPVLAVKAQLRDPAELRRAILLREVLGPPVGLR